MRCPALLSAKLLKVRIAGLVRKAHREHLIEFVDAAEILHANSDHPISHEKIRSILDSLVPVLWIGGSEPLEHPGIAHLVRAIAQSKRYIFLETHGALLRRRIHEFQPTPQLFLTVRIDVPARSGREDDREAGALELALEGIRAARLSGFFTTLHSVVREDLDISQVRDFAGMVSHLKIDGWLVTAAANTDSALHNADAARQFIPNSQWRWFSVQLERELQSAGKASEMHRTLPNEKVATDEREERVRVA